MTVADRIKALRTEKGITQTELAKRLGNKDKSTICKIESRGNDISLKDIKRIAEALETTPSYLMGWDNPENPVLGQKMEWYNEDIAHMIIQLKNDGHTTELISMFLQLSPAKKEVVMNLVRTLLLDEHPGQGHKDSL